MTGAQVAAAAAVLAGAGCHSATGFGFALVAAPLVVAAYPAREAIAVLLVLGALVNVLALTTELRRPATRWAESGLLLAWMAPGAVTGALLLDRIDRAALQILVSISVVAALLVRWRARRAANAIAPLPWLGAAGLTAGALTTTTTANGPPLLLYLLGRKASPAEVRDSLALLFIASALVGLTTLAAAGPGISLPGAGAVATLVAATTLGQLAGRPLFARLAASRYELVVAALLATSMVAGATLALT